MEQLALAQLTAAGGPEAGPEGLWGLCQAVVTALPFPFSPVSLGPCLQRCSEAVCSPTCKREQAGVLPNRFGRDLGWQLFLGTPGRVTVALCKRSKRAASGARDLGEFG